jgi:hypothetical protein
MSTNTCTVAYWVSKFFLGLWYVYVHYAAKLYPIVHDLADGGHLCGISCDQPTTTNLTKRAIPVGTQDIHASCQTGACRNCWHLKAVGENVQGSLESEQ